MQTSVPEVLGVFKAAGCIVESKDADARLTFRPPPSEAGSNLLSALAALDMAGAGAADAAAPNDESKQRSAGHLKAWLGLEPDARACDAWQIARRSAELTAAKAQPQDPRVHTALRNAAVCISAARAAAAARRADWCFAALHGAEPDLAALRACAEGASGAHPGGPRAVQAAVKDVKHVANGLREPFKASMEVIEEVPKGQRACVDHESVVFLIANLDSMYYVLFDHYLTSDDPATPAVPPPHHYFPAHVELLQPEADDATRALLARAGDAQTAAFCAAWDAEVRGGALRLKSGADPLRQVMLARWQEAAVLLFARGFGTAGEMDEVAQEEADLIAWLEQQKAQREGGASAEDAAAALQEVDEGSQGREAAAEAARPRAGDGEEGRIGGVPAAELDAAFRGALGLDDDNARSDSTRSEAGSSQADGERPPPPAYTALQAYRDCARSWPCHLYAFAAPNEVALSALEALGPLLEVGAGVGYWAALLQGRGGNVIATDSKPTADCSGDEVNSFHGRVPAWTAVQAAGADCAAEHRDRALFLCYPPPNSPMGHDALRAYEGDHVALVGEWDGDTGDRALSHALLTEWRLERAINLPNWSDTAHDLTIWRRRAEAVPLVQAPWPRCCETGATLGECLQAEKGRLRRCRYLRTLLLRDASSWAKFRSAARQMLALSFVFFKRELDFASDLDFEDVSIGLAASGEPASS